MKSVDWVEIQTYYNNNTLKDTLEKFKIGKSFFYKGVHLGLIKNRSMSESLKLSLGKLPKRKHSEETKKKMSEIRKKFILENPEKAPYKINHSSKESYPEKYFADLFERENIRVEKQYQIGLYSLDFCIPEKKIDIEIDGNQHYCDSRIIESDKRRTTFLKENGWDVIRIKWSDYNRLSLLDRNEFIDSLKRFIDKISEEKPTIIIENKKICVCGSPKLIKSDTCIKCRGLRDRTVDRPPYEILKKEIEELGYRKVGRKYGVSDSSIRKWIKSYIDKGIRETHESHKK